MASPTNRGHDAGEVFNHAFPPCEHCEQFEARQNRFNSQGSGLMTCSSHLHVIRLLAFTVWVPFLAATSGAQERPPIVEQMAKTYGIDSFGQIEKIRYSWNLEIPGVKIANSCEWEPKTGQISYEGKDKGGKAVKLTYQRSQLGTQSDAVKEEVDPASINDQYGLLLPLHDVWD